MTQLGKEPRREPEPELTPELRDFLDRAIVPALVDAYLAELEAGKLPADAPEASLDPAPGCPIRRRPAKSSPAALDSPEGKA